MKSMRMLFVLVVSMTSVIANAIDCKPTNNPEFILKIGKYATLGFLLTPSERNNNFLHNLAEMEKLSENEKLKFRLTLELECGLIKKEENEEILKAPYNEYSEGIARQLYRKNLAEKVFDETVDNVLDTLSESLLQKNDNDNTPMDLLKENKVDSAAIEQEIKKLQDPEVRAGLKFLIKVWAKQLG